SGSAARSIHGGWVSWDGPEARQVAAADHWDVAMVVAILNAGPKDVGSRDGMNLSRDTSPFYASWVQNAQRLHEEGTEALLTRDLPRLITAMEASTLRMHAVAMTSEPSVIYWTPQTWAVLNRVRALRSSEGLCCGFTMDAGPNVKVLCRTEDAAGIAETLGQQPGVQETLVCRPGGAVQVEVQGRGDT
ncbi:MAG: diphosphomevalonate decarboxylase, partial [Myxococcota bacterium]|nr:diphosphomevalonate decarboxylase [Myxococcota bacterium]